LIIQKVDKKLQSRQDMNKNRDLGELYYYYGQFEKADQFLDYYIERFDNDYVVYLLKALTAAELSENDASSEYIDHAIEINPRCSKCWLIKAEIAINRNEFAEAKRALIISNYINRSPKAQLLLANIYYFQGKPDERLVALQSVADITLSQNLDSHWMASRWHFMNRHFKFLPLGLTYQDYYSPVVSAGEDIEKISCSMAAELYMKAMSLDKISNDYFQEKYDDLDCNTNEMK
jgi:tetratricopeptide (TPR) repeat protein